MALDRLPKYAVPVMVIIRDEPFGVCNSSQARFSVVPHRSGKERTPSGKILKQVVRKSARAEWEKRCRVPSQVKL